MNDKILHINNLEDNSSGFFSNGEISWKKSQEEVWAELENKIIRLPVDNPGRIISIVTKLAAAAIFALLLGLSATFLYTKTVVCVPGENQIAQLPDGSTVEMNSGSSLKYYPLKWIFQRSLYFEGEGYFKVTKGTKFEAVSANGKTRVMGTSFNIYARDHNYRVTCITGSVKVISNSNESVLLNPNNHVELRNGRLVMKTNYKTEKAIDWKVNQFDFTSRPLQEVFGEIARRYAVDIKLQPELRNRSFSSNFSKPESVEDVLDYVCKSMQLSYVKQAENVFLVVKNNQWQN